MDIEDIREKRQNKNKPKKFFWINLWSWIKKNKWKILITLIILFILVDPVNSATLIGTWINKFIGFLIKTITI